MEVAEKIEHQKSSQSSKVEEFYEKVTRDYQFWDSSDNMHFGFAKSLKEMFSLSAMVKNMNEKVLSNFNNLEYPTLADIGCGSGATMKYAHRFFPNFHIYGFTISRFQKERGSRKLSQLGSLNSIVRADYENMPAPDETFHGAYAIESLCHSGCSKTAISEIYRTLKPNGKFVIADAFIKKPKICPPARWVKNKMEKNWQLQEIITISELNERLKSQGFKEIKIRKITWKVAPSVLYIPKTIFKFYWARLFQKEKIHQFSHHNAWASFYTLLTSFFVSSFGYYMISSEK